ncbi:hypothetical protein CVT24_002953 [Panaeolus cyanescens]|uniref:Protein CPL1-like domain-containing protein n=1 Tax=Panaeolus cyanescens TaxID=181874 RepID=A0A409VPF8_9AGAR|nr:hypothetical protein CVT24_002953 [Panaeolus cyanescens]
MLFKSFIGVVLSLSSVAHATGGKPGGGGGGDDVCGEVNGSLVVKSQFFPYKSVNYGPIRGCFCISNLPGILATNPNAIAAVALSGKSAVIDAITDLINKCNGHQTCRYPPNSVPACLPGNPCGFTCKNGFFPTPTKKPTSCTCPKPYTVCNGQCGLYKACPSGHVKRELSGTARRCPYGLTACGIPGRGLQSWECVDTRSDLESCKINVLPLSSTQLISIGSSSIGGGCMLSLDPLYPEGNGVDCSAIRGVSDVSCVRSRCVVHRCMPGFKPTPYGDNCTEEKHDTEELLASQFGLEHVPLGQRDEDE